MRLCCLVAVAMLMGLQFARSAEPTAGGGPRTLYVDAVQGDDARDGLRPETAWRSLGKVNGAPLHPGDRVLLRRGQTWRGQLIPQSGDASGVITYSAYGEGSKPLLLGSAAMSRAEDWQPAGEGLWATTPVRFDPVGVQADLRRLRWWLHQEGGAACTFVAPAPGGNAEYRIECRSPGVSPNHIQLTAGGLSVRDGEYYVLTFRARCSRPFKLARVAIMKDAAPYPGYATVDSAMPSIAGEWTDCTVRFLATQTGDDARITFFFGGSLPAGAVLQLQPGTLTAARCSCPIPLSVDVGNIIFNDGQATGFKKWREADLKNEGDYVYDAARWQVKLRMNGNPATRYRSVELALNRHVINEGGRGYITYQDLALRYGAAHGIGGGATQHITVRDCDISYIGGGHQNTRPDGKPVRFGNGIEFWAGARDCLVEGCRIWEIYDAALTDQGSGVNVQENITYRGNVIWNSEYSFEFWNRGTESRTRNIRFEHNTCVNAGAGWGHRQRPDPNGRHLMFYDNSSATENVVIRYNIFCNATDSCLRLQGRDWTRALTLDDNCWFQSKGPLVLWGQESIDAGAFARFMGARGFAAHSLVADPRFVNPAQNDYRLAPDSPARALSEQGRPVGALP